MAVMMPRQTWTDERLDHFEKHVDERFDQVDERFDNFEEKVDERFERVNERFGEVSKRLEGMDADIRELRVAVLGIQRVMAQGFVAICAVMIAGFTALAGLLG
jgi:archaellum component FlaC